MIRNSGEEVRYWYAEGVKEGRSQSTRLAAAARAVVEALEREPVILDLIAAAPDVDQALAALRDALTGTEG